MEIAIVCDGWILFSESAMKPMGDMPF
jgi:hypothetical protein